MDGLAKYEGYKFIKESVTKVTDSLTIEQPLEININDKPFTVVMQTPGNELELSIGLLYAENVLPADYIPNYQVQRDERNLINRINLEVNPDQLGNGYISTRSLLSVSSCGICGKQSLEDLHVPTGNFPSNTKKVSIKTLRKMQEIFVENQQLFKATGGCHGVAAFSYQQNLLAIHEDIGRHNALDKVVGQLIIQQLITDAKILMFSGRVSYEIVSKAFRAKIPIIMAVSAPSSLAIDFAKEFGITILGFSRNSKTTVYANPNRIDFK
ncbi:formate dehydrogenase accessory sulfurtransferase FdhD [Crocinitomix algicola]|uniref:formate dehydrogenase accessory sulfurtransferase FdhD n=1 Tax=Crocinitomix algicola TaxID=1740263 RepID=UPI000872C5E3|nr:formate dehydrogenase accessory sulfurtransferase FdhD [Crocinitomix algicola]